MTKKLSFKSAAKKILEQSSEPMSAGTIVKKAIEEGLIETSGNTPEATMGAQIYVDIKKKPNSVFKKVGKGLFTVKKQAQQSHSPLVMIEMQNDLTKKKLKELLYNIDPYQFEFLIADLLQKIGYENIAVTKQSGDKGIDVVANLTIDGITNVKTVIQAKRYSEKNTVDGKTITQLRGSAEVDQRGLVITTSKFTAGAVEESKAPNKMPVSLVDGERLTELLIKYGVGVEKKELYTLQIDEEYFENHIAFPGHVDSEKNRSLWPLPGGNHNYIDTLNRFLKEIQSGNDKKEGLSKWYISNFDNVESETTTQGYIYVPKSMGLTTIMDGRYVLTEEGTQYIKHPDLELLYEIMARNVLVFDDIYEFIKSSSGTVTEKMVLEYLKENFDINWTTYSQVTYRLLWLLNLKKIEKTSSGYGVKD